MTSSSSDMAENPQKSPKRGRTIARVAAVQILFQSEQTQQPAASVLEEFVKHRYIPRASISSELALNDGIMTFVDLKLLEKIINLTAAKKEEIDRTLTSLLPEPWPIDRLDPVLRALLRVALAEMATDIPTQIVINEYLDVAHGFFDGEEPKMTNAILDNFAQKDRKYL